MSVMVVGAAVVWAAAAFQAGVVVRGDGDAGTRWHVAGFTALAAALTLNLPTIYTAFDDLAGQPNLGELVVHAFALVAAWSAYAAIVTSLYVGALVRRRIAGSAVALAVTITVMAFLFVAAPVDAEVTDFTTVYATTPYVAEYFLVYLAFAAAVLVDMAWVTWRYRRSVATLVGVGLRLLAIGAILGLAYVALKAGYLATRRWTDIDLDTTAVATTSHLALVLCAVCCVTGATLPRWGANASRAASWCRRYVTYHRLRPLWRTLTAACPDVILGAPRPPMVDALDPRRLDFRLYRRMIEIRDCQLELRRYVDGAAVTHAETAAAAHGLQRNELEAFAEAAALATALALKTQGKTGSGWNPRELDGPTDLVSEAKRLLLVGSFFRDMAASPATRKVLESHA